MPALEFWFTGTAIFIAASFAFSVVTTLLGLHSLVHRKIFLLLIVCAVVLGFFAWRSAAKQELDIATQQETVASQAATIKGMKATLDRMENSNTGQWEKLLETLQKTSAAPKPQIQPPPSPPIKLPEVTLKFVGPKEPSLVLTNISDAIARDIKWTVVLWNVDHPEREDPLPIPVSTFDWIRPRDVGGPQSLFNSSLVKPLLKNGERLFGSAAVICPECVRGRTFWVYIEFGKGGWYAEIESEKRGKLYFPKPRPGQEPDAFLREVFTIIPENSRKAIESFQ